MHFIDTLELEVEPCFQSFVYHLHQYSFFEWLFLNRLLQDLSVQLYFIVQHTQYLPYCNGLLNTIHCSVVNFCIICCCLQTCILTQHFAFVLVVSEHYSMFTEFLSLSYLYHLAQTQYSFNQNIVLKNYIISTNCYFPFICTG